MKQRVSFVSNSSSSSFLLPSLPDENLTQCHVGYYELPKEYVELIEKNHFNWKGEHLELSGKSDKWYLTTILSDCMEDYGKIADYPGAVEYEEWHGEPDMYMDEGEVVTFHRGYDDFYLLSSDFVGFGKDGIPDIVSLRESANRIFEDKHLTATKKLYALKKLFEY